MRKSRQPYLTPGSTQPAGFESTNTDYAVANYHEANFLAQVAVGFVSQIIDWQNLITTM
jgi:hypothetical protein